MSQFNLRYVPTLSCSQFILNGQQFNTQAANLIDGNGNITATPALTTQVIINDATKNQALFAEIYGNIHGNTFPQLQAEIVALQGNVLILQGEMNAVEGNVAILQGNVITINNQIANINANVSGITANTQYLHAPYNGLAGNTSYFTNGLQVWNGGSETGNGIFSYVDGGAPANQIRLSVQNAKGIFLDGGSTTIAPTSGGNVNITGSGGTAPFNFIVKNPGLVNNATIQMKGNIELTGNGNSSISIFTQPASLIPPVPATDYVNIRGGDVAQVLGPSINIQADTGGSVSLGTPSTGSTNSTINIGTSQGSTNTGYQVITIGSGGVLQARNSSTFLEGDNYLPYVAATNTGLWDGIAYVGLPTAYSGPLHGPIKTTYTPYVKSISTYFAGATVNSFISTAGSFTVGVGVGSINLTCGAGGFLCSTGAGLLALTTGIGAIALTTAGGAITATTAGGAIQFSLGAGSFTSTTGVGVQRLETGAADIQIAAGYAPSGTAGDVVITAKGNISVSPDVGLYLEKVSHAAFINNGTTPPGLPNYSLYTVNGNLFFNGTDISSSSGVSQVIAGNGITVSPIGGTGVVTVSAIGSVIPPGGYLPVIGGNMVGDIYMKNTSSSAASHIYQGDGAGQVKLFRPMSSYQAPFPSIGPPTYTGELLCFYNGDNNSPTQSNFTGWFPQSLVSAEPDVMTQLITGTPATVYSLANTSTPSPYDNTSCTTFPTFTNGVHITGGTVYISQIETTKPLTLTFGYPDGTPFYTATFAAGSFPSTGLFTFTVDYTHTLSTGQYTAYWDNSNSNFSMMVANPVIKTNWCGTLLAGTSSYYLMAFNSGLTSQIFKWFPGQNTTEKVFTLDGSLYGIQEQLIGSRILYFYGLFDNITVPGPVSARVNNIFIYNVDTGIVQTLSADTALQQNPPLGTNGAVYGVEVDTFNDRTWFWGDFDYVGTDYLGNPTPQRNDIVLKCGCDFTTTADWQLPVMFEGINGYRGCRGGKLLNYAGAYYSLMVWAEEQSDGNNPPAFLPFNTVGMNYYQTGTFVWTVANGNVFAGGIITQPVANIQSIGSYLFFTGSFNNGVAYLSGNTCLSIMYSVSGSNVDNTVGSYGSELYEAYNSSNTGFWVDNGVQITVSNLREMSNNLLVMNTNGYGLTNGGGVLAVQIASTTSLPTKYPITGMPRYNTKFIGGNDATKILLTCSLNQNNFFYSQTFDSTPSPTPTDPTVIAINGAKFLVDNTPMDKIVFAGSNQDYSSVSFIAGKVEDNDYNWYWQAQVGELNYYDGATLYANICACPAAAPIVPNIAQVLSVGNNAALNNLTNVGSISSASATITYATTQSLDATLIGDILATGLSINPDGNLRIKGAITKGSLLAGDGTDTIEFPISSNNLYLKANSSTSSGLQWASLTGVASITNGTNINITGTATVPIINLRNPLTAPLNLGTQNCQGTSSQITLTNGGSVANTTATIGFTSADSVNPNNIKSVLYKTGLTLKDVNDLHTITPIGITYTGTSLYQVQSNGSMRITAGGGAAGYTQITQAVNSGTTLVTTIDNTKYYPDTVITNQNLSTVGVPNPQVDYQRLTLTNLGLTNTNVWSDYGSNVFTFSAFSIDGNNNVWLASTSGFIHIYDSTITNLLYTLQVTYSGGAGTINVFYLQSGFMFIGGIFDTVIDVNGSNATPQYSIARVNPSTYLFEPMDGVQAIRGFQIGSQVFCMTDVNGALVCGGSFTTFSNGNTCNHIGEITLPYNAGGSQVFNEYANGADNNVYAIYFTAFLNYTFIGGDFGNVNVSSSPSSFAYCAFYDNGATTWYQVASGYLNSSVYIIKPSFAGYLLIAGAFGSLNGATEAYNAYIEEANPTNFASTTLNLNGTVPSYKQGYYNGENALIGFDNTFYRSSGYQSWTSLGQVGGAGQVNGINNWNGDWKIITDNHTYVRSHTNVSHSCAFTGSFIYDGTAYSTYTITLRNVSQQFIGDDDNSYWSIIGQGVGAFS